MDERGPERLLTMTMAVAVALLFLGATLTLLSREEVETPPPTLGRLLDETWVADSIEPPSLPSESIEFQVDRGVSELELTYAVQLPSADLRQVEFLNATHAMEPFVTLQLRDRSEAVVWQSWTDETTGGSFPVEDPLFGTWCLRVVARMYGVNATAASAVPLDFADSVHVIVTAF